MESRSYRWHCHCLGRSREIGRREHQHGRSPMTRLAPGAALAFLVFAGLLPIVNPLGSAPMFLAMTSGLSTRTRRWLAWRVAVNGLVLLLVSIFVGSHILDFFGISLPVVQVG